MYPSIHPSVHAIIIHPQIYHLCPLVLSFNPGWWCMVAMVLGGGGQAGRWERCQRANRSEQNREMPVGQQVRTEQRDASRPTSQNRTEGQNDYGGHCKRRGGRLTLKSIAICTGARRWWRSLGPYNRGKGALLFHCRDDIGRWEWENAVCTATVCREADRRGCHGGARRHYCNKANISTNQRGVSPWHRSLKNQDVLDSFD